jgi:hypothetical protein
MKTQQAQKSSRRALLVTVLGAVGLFVPAVAAAPASATGSYPGETLSLAQAGPAVAGKVALFVASGRQTDVAGYAGGFNLDVFAKDPRVDPSCAPDLVGEGNAAITDRSEFRVVVGQWQGTATSFSLRFKTMLKPGPVLLCAYSDWITDTAASAHLRITVAHAGSTARPKNIAKPRVTRSGNSLVCATGSWANNPSRFEFGWLLDRILRQGTHSKRLTLSRTLRSHTVRCTVSASNRFGTTTAISTPYRVH